MPYFNVNRDRLYDTTRSYISFNTDIDHTFENAVAWLEAKDILDVWVVIQAWFQLMQDDELGIDEVSTRNPDPEWNDADYPDFHPITLELADVFIEEMDADFDLEKARYQGRLGPEFKRLSPDARIAFLQDCYRVMRSSKSMELEAKERLARGEILPPPTSKSGKREEIEYDY